MKSIKIITSLLVVLILIGCQNKVSGTYTGKGTAYFDQLNFTSSHTVELVFMGATKEAQYSVKGNKIYIRTAGDTQILTINNNDCLDGGGYIGSYCKNKIITRFIMSL